MTHSKCKSNRTISLHKTLLLPLDKYGVRGINQNIDCLLFTPLASHYPTVLSLSWSNVTTFSFSHLWVPATGFLHWLSPLPGTLFSFSLPGKLQPQFFRKITTPNLPLRDLHCSLCSTCLGSTLTFVGVVSAYKFHKIRNRTYVSLAVYF